MRHLTRTHRLEGRTSEAEPMTKSRFSSRCLFVLALTSAVVVALTVGAGVGAASGVSVVSPNMVCACGGGGGAYYIDPFYAATGITAQRTDMGVDYDGYGQITAMGTGTVWWVYAPGCSASDPGWCGYYLWYKLSEGPLAGDYIYVAEGINKPVVANDSHIVIGQELATFVPNSSTGIETGWATSTAQLNLYHDHCGSYDNSGATVIGDSFARFLLSVGRATEYTPPDPYSGALYTTQCGYSAS